MDKTPEQLAQERSDALQAARLGKPGDPTVPPSGGRERVDFKQKAQEAKQMQREQPLARAEITNAQATEWSTRDKVLLQTDNTGTPLHQVDKNVTMAAAGAYGPQSIKAIEAINECFSRDECSEIHFSGPSNLFAKINGRRVRINVEFSKLSEYNKFVEDLISQADTNIQLEDIKRRARSVIRMAGGDRMAIVMPPITQYIAVAIHKVVARTWDMSTLVNNGTLTQAMAEFLQAAVRAKANIIICGEMGAGKSTMLSLMVAQISPEDKIALVEEVPEIFVDNIPDTLRLTYYPESMTDVPMGLPQIIDSLLYMRMDRVIVGEIHDKGMYSMLRVMSTGSDGSLSTFHAGTVKGALEQVKNHVLLEHENLPSHVAANFVRQAINLIVVLERVDGEHRVVEVGEVEWRNMNEDTSQLTANILYEFDRESKEFKSKGRLDQNGMIVKKARKHGVHLENSWFAGSEFGKRG